MKKFSLILILLLFTSCSSLPGRNSENLRNYAQTDTTSCFEALDLIAHDSQEARSKALNFISSKLENRDT